MSVSEKAICIASCVYIIVQMLLHMGFCFWGIDVMKCNIKPVQQKGVFYYLYLTYFLNDSCYAATFSEIIPKSFDDKYVQSIFNYSDIKNLSFPDVSPNREKTYLIFETYIVLNTFLILATLTLLVTECLKFKSLVSRIWYVPWVFTMALVIIYDMGVGAWFASHIPDTFGLLKWFRHLTREPDSKAIYSLNTVYPRITTAWPAIFMTAVFTRFLILWYINVCVFMFIFETAVKSYFKPEIKKDLSSNSKCVCKPPLSDCGCKSEQLECDCKDENLDHKCKPDTSDCEFKDDATDCEFKPDTFDCEFN